MKKIIEGVIVLVAVIIWGCSGGMPVRAQTNAVFDQLLSSSNTVLMTNAEFSKAYGRRLVFHSGTDSKAFDVQQLAPSVLERLNIDAGQLTAAQAKTDAAQKAQADAMRKQAHDQKIIEGNAEASVDPQPQRQEKTPVDLNDSRACLYELAELATFPMYLGKFENQRGMGLFFWGDPYDMAATIAITDSTVRFDHLEEGKDPQFRELVKEARGLVTDVWRVYRARRNCGLGWRIRAVENTEKGAIVADIWNMVTRNNTEIYQDQWGYHTVTYPPTTAQLETDEQNKDTIVRSQKMRATLDSYDRTMVMVEGIAFDELGVFWEQKLLPRLKAAGNPGVKQKFLSSNEGGALMDAEGGIQSGIAIGSISLRNSSANILNNVAISIEQGGIYGEMTRWYGFVPALPPGGFFFAVKRGCQADLMRRTGTEKPATVSVIMPTGEQEGFPARDCIEGYEENIGESMMGHVSYGVPHFQPWDKTRPTEVAKMKQLHDWAAGRADAVTDEAKKMREYFSTNFPGLANPTTARAKLDQALTPGKDYRLEPPKDPEMESEVMSLGTNESGIFGMTMKATWKRTADFKELQFARRLWYRRELAGRYCEGDEAGCVMGFAETVPDLTVWTQTIGKVVGPQKVNAEMQRVRLDGIRVKNQVRTREIWLLTSPTDIYNAKMDGKISGGHADVVDQNLLSTRPQATQTLMALRKEQQRIRNTVAAPYAIYVDTGGQLWVQCVNKHTDEVKSRQLK